MSDDISTWGTGTYAFTQLVNHLNQVYCCVCFIRHLILYYKRFLLKKKEKSSLLEKVEHYERDLQVNVKKSNDTHRSAMSFGSDLGNGHEVLSDFSTNLDNEYEFYYEKNVRP